MKSDLVSRIAAAVVLLVPLAPALAQDSVSMKLDVVAWGDEIPGLTVGAGKGDPFTALSFSYSKPVSYTGSPVMEIHQDPALAAKATEGSQNAAAISPDLAKIRKTDPTVVALAKLPMGSKRATVLIAPAQAGTYQTFVIDDDPSKLPFGKLRIHNYSPFKIAIRVNGKEGMQMKTKDSFVVEPKNGEVIYELAYEEAGQWKIQESNLIPVKKDQQVQFIVLKSDADFFTSSDGSRSGFLQAVTLKRSAADDAAASR